VTGNLTAEYAMCMSLGVVGRERRCVTTLAVHGQGRPI